MSAGRLRGGGALLPAVAALALLAGCGSSGDFASKIGGGDATAQPAVVPAAPIMPQAAAASVSLRAIDFPFLKESERESGSPDEGRMGRELEECVGKVSLGGEQASAHSPSFNGLLGGEFLEFSSDSGVFLTHTHAGGLVGLMRKQRVFGCFARIVKPAVERGEAGSEVEVLSVRTRRLRFPGGPRPDSFAFRIRATVAEAPESRQLTAYEPGETRDGRPTFSIYLDILTFVRGRVEVDLTATGGPQPVPASLERNLLRLLRERADEAGERLR